MQTLLCRNRGFREKSLPGFRPVRWVRWRGSAVGTTRLLTRNPSGHEGPAFISNRSMIVWCRSVGQGCRPSLLRAQSRVAGQS
jgi:hypothetical protein